MINIADLKIGDKVCYQPDHYKDFYEVENPIKGEPSTKEDKWENGMVKEIPNHTNTAIRVVYNCTGDWDNFKDYTGALTNIRDLTLNWRHE